MSQIQQNQGCESPWGHFKPPQLLSPLPPPSNQPDKTRPSQNPSHGPKECVLVGKRILGSRSNNRELWQRPAHSCEAVPSFSTNTARAGTARPCSSPAAPWGPGWAQEFPVLGDSQLKRLRERWRIPGNTAQPSDTPGWAGSSREKVGPRKGQGWGQRRDRTGLPGDGTGRRGGQKAPGETLGVILGTDGPAGEGSWSSKAICDLCRGLEDKSAALC